MSQLIFQSTMLLPPSPGGHYEPVQVNVRSPSPDGAQVHVNPKCSGTQAHVGFVPHADGSGRHWKVP